MLKINQNLLNLPELIFTEPMTTTQTCGNTYFELSNHLGNVLAVVTDRKLAQPDGGTGISFYLPDVVSATDYYPFVQQNNELCISTSEVDFANPAISGRMQMSERSFSGDDYRYGFNGKEKDSEGMGGGGSTYDYGFRIYNPQIAKFLSVDPLFQSFPWWSPYQFAGDMPISAIDLDGLEVLFSPYLALASSSATITLSNTATIPKPAVSLTRVTETLSALSKDVVNTAPKTTPHKLPFPPVAVSPAESPTAGQPQTAPPPETTAKSSKTTTATTATSTSPTAVPVIEPMPLPPIVPDALKVDVPELTSLQIPESMPATSDVKPLPLEEVTPTDPVTNAKQEIVKKQPKDLAQEGRDAVAKREVAASRQA